MEIERYPVGMPPKHARHLTIEEFADQHGLVMEVHERDDPKLPRYYATFKDVNVVDGVLLRGEYGNGDTEEEAIRNYGDALSFKTIVVNAGMANRREINVPRIVRRRTA